MIASAHLAMGAALGSLVHKGLKIRNNRAENWLVFTLGFLSHLLLDAIPHKEYGVSVLGMSTYVFFEILLVFALVFSTEDTRLNSVTLRGILGAAMPDFFSMFAHFLAWWPLLKLDRIIHYYHGYLPMPTVSLKVQFFGALTIVLFLKIYPKLFRSRNLLNF